MKIKSEEIIYTIAFFLGSSVLVSYLIGDQYKEVKETLNMKLWSIFNGKTFPITSPFGIRIHPVTKELKHHNGIDIACPINTPLYASCDGIIHFSQDAGYSGLNIRLRNDNLIIGYSHCNKLLYKEGALVKKGQIIAYSGNTGRSTGPHLHLSTQLEGKFLDPLKIFYL